MDSLALWRAGLEPGRAGVLLRRLGRLRNGFAKRRSTSQPGAGLTNRERMRWMLQTTGARTASSTAWWCRACRPAPFFASTTILIIGGLLAVLSTTERASGSCARSRSRRAPRCWSSTWKIVLLLTAIFVYAFFRFTWSQRQYSFGAILVAAAPEHRNSPPTRNARPSPTAPAVVGLAADLQRRPARATTSPSRPRPGSSRPGP